MRKLLKPKYFVAPHVLEIRQIPSSFMVLSEQGTDASGEHEKMHEKWGYQSGNEKKLGFPRKLLPIFVGRLFWCLRIFLNTFFHEKNLNPHKS